MKSMLFFLSRAVGLELSCSMLLFRDLVINLALCWDGRVFLKEIGRWCICGFWTFWIGVLLSMVRCESFCIGGLFWIRFGNIVWVVSHCDWFCDLFFESNCCLVLSGIFELILSARLRSGTTLYTIEFVFGFEPISLFRRLWSICWIRYMPVHWPGGNVTWAS